MKRTAALLLVYVVLYPLLWVIIFISFAVVVLQASYLRWKVGRKLTKDDWYNAGWSKDTKFYNSD